MRAKIVAVALAVTITLANGSACAMNAPSEAKPVACRVVDGDKLPAASGGADALCAAIEKAAQARFSVEVRVLSPSALAAAVTMADGRSLPEQKLVVSDRALTTSSFDRFARSIASEVARAQGR